MKFVKRGEIISKSNYRKFGFIKKPRSPETLAEKLNFLDKEEIGSYVRIILGSFKYFGWLIVTPCWPQFMFS